MLKAPVESDLEYSMKVLVVAVVEGLVTWSTLNEIRPPGK